MEESLDLRRERSHKNVGYEPFDQAELLVRHLGQWRTRLDGAGDSIASVQSELQVGNFATFSSSSFGKR